MPFKKIGGTEKGGRVSSIPVRVAVRFNLIYFMVINPLVLKKVRTDALKRVVR
jgi:hypothetical protein